MAVKKPLVIANGRKQQLQSGDSLVFTGLALITASTTLYVATNGSDTAGDGSSSNPWASLNQAIAYLNGCAFASGITVTVSIAAGTYNMTAPVTINHPQGAQIQIVGASNGANTLIANSASTGPASGKTTVRMQMGSWQAGFATNNYLLALGVYGFTDASHGWIGAGCGLITALGNPYLTYSLDSYSANACGSITSGSPAYYLTTILNFTGCDGIVLTDLASQNYSLGLLSNLVLTGQSGYTALKAGNVRVSTCGFVGGWTNGLWCANHGTAYVSQSAAGGCAIGFCAQHNSYVYLANCVANGNRAHGVYAGYNSVVWLAATITAGNSGNGVWSEYSSLVYIYTSTFSCDNTVNGVVTTRRSATIIYSGHLEANYNQNLGLLTQDVSAVYGCAAAVIASASPTVAAGTAGNNGSYNFSTV